MPATSGELTGVLPLVPGSVPPLFWPSLRPDHASAWHGHVSFAHWLIAELRPRSVVELGTHNGVSFMAFCNAAARLGLDTRCYAVDSWEGDVQAGQYGEEVFLDVSRFVSARFASRAVLLRCYFDAALTQFASGSIDLLHIDGLHTYEAVANDFHSWRPKLSERGVVLFHDTDIYNTDFGVWRLWAELSKSHPHFRFSHSAGLGVLATGPVIPPALATLFSLDEFADGDDVRNTFERASTMARMAGRVERRRDADAYLAAIPQSRRNVALNCFTLQSSFEPGSTPIAFGAVDGRKTGGYGFHTAHEAMPWWIVDLGGEQSIDEIVVYNRLDEDCRNRARTLEIAVSSDGHRWSPVYQHNGLPFGGVDGNPLRVPASAARARFVRLALRETGFLHLDQVEIYAPKVF